jgi:hypothetical protein
MPNPSLVALQSRIHSYARGAYCTVVFKANSFCSGVSSANALAPEMTLYVSKGVRSALKRVKLM